MKPQLEVYPAIGLLDDPLTRSAATPLDLATLYPEEVGARPSNDKPPFSP